jgi:ABC-type spermidine/putrescine transport system permease subunit I
MKSVQDQKGNFIGLKNYLLYLQEPALFQSFFNSLFIAIVSTIIVVILAFSFAYALTRTCIPFKGFFRLIALIPLLSPSILAAIALVYWFGNKGILKALLFGNSIYGPIGIIFASVYWTFPHALMILSTSLSLSDSRLYEAAEVLKTSRLRAFLTITIPGARYGIISTSFVIFTQVFTDFGVPKVIGGNYNMLATDIYKEVVGMQNFQMGAVISLVLLLPSLIAFFIDQYSRKKQISLLTSRSVVFKPKKSFGVDSLMLGYCTIITLFILMMIGMAQFGALVKFWPYDLSFTLQHYQFEVAGLGWESFYNSIRLAFYTAIFGTIREIFASLPESKMKGFSAGRFSFNVKDGSCSECSGAGSIRLEMSFLPDVNIQCESCEGKRFDQETLSIFYRGKNIADVLDMNFLDAASFFSGFPLLKNKIDVINSVGLEYLKLGQDATTLSGGEAQRIKLSKELIKKNTGKTFYILDEPTIGLHYEDIDKLLSVIYQLRHLGNTVVIIEHNMEIVNASDYILDLGPDGGASGGYLTFQGLKKDFLSAKNSETAKFLRAHIKELER